MIGFGAKHSTLDHELIRGAILRGFHEPTAKEYSAVDVPEIQQFDGSIDFKGKPPNLYWSFVNFLNDLNKAKG